MHKIKSGEKVWNLFLSWKYTATKFTKFGSTKVGYLSAYVGTYTDV